MFSFRVLFKLKKKQGITDSALSSLFAKWLMEVAMRIAQDLFHDQIMCVDVANYEFYLVAVSPTTVSHNGHTFIFHQTERVSWDEAIRLCESKGSRLAEIYDYETYTVLRNNLM